MHPHNQGGQILMGIVSRHSEHSGLIPLRLLIRNLKTAPVNWGWNNTNTICLGTGVVCSEVTSDLIGDRNNAGGSPARRPMCIGQPTALCSREVVRKMPKL